MVKGVKGQYTEKEIIEAIEMIKDICDRQEDCERCPFFAEDYVDCNFNLYDPGGWEIKKENEVWRVFI